MLKNQIKLIFYYAEGTYTDFKENKRVSIG